MRMPPSASVSRPVTSALILPRSRNSGRRRLERVRHAAAERAQHDGGDAGQPPVEIEQDAEREDRGDDAADELHEAGADQIADAFGVAHDARDQDAGLRRVEVARPAAA